jgi:hypothetical protein
MATLCVFLTPLPRRLNAADLIEHSDDGRLEEKKKKKKKHHTSCPQGAVAIPAARCVFHLFIYLRREVISLAGCFAFPTSS